VSATGGSIIAGPEHFSGDQGQGKRIASGKDPGERTTSRPRICETNEGKHGGREKGAGRTLTRPSNTPVAEGSGQQIKDRSVL